MKTNTNTVNFAFGLKDENIHAPDEFWRLKNFKLAQKAHGMLLEELGRCNLTADEHP